MGELVPITTTTGVTLVAPRSDTLADYEKRLKEARELETKLTKINEEIPTRIYNVSGSCAGAGSGDFHYYRQIRRAEQDRLRRMDAEDREQEQRKGFEDKLKQRQDEAEAKTAKNRSKRQKKKEKKQAAKLAKRADGDKGDGAEGGGGSGSGGASSGEEQPELD
ncbi:MAG: hypothetical protein J3K34DRAFT_418907 [Monoraphidium minutum]|nr:MAG: hypothetical protein J3K34DRAFT_418907 [Monoraphidium minutum]